MEIAHSSRRSGYIDFLKGLAIVFVVLGHCWLTPTDVIWLIYRFHMPLFFLISGYLLNNRMNVGFKVFFIKKARQILLPYSIFCLFSFCFSNVFLTNKPDVNEGIQALFLSNKYLNFINNWALWYLPLFFITLIIFYLISKIKNRNIHILIIVSLLIIAPIFQSFMKGIYPKMDTPLAIHVLPAALACMLIGYMMKEYKYNGVLHKRNAVNSILCIIIGIVGILLSLNSNESILEFESWKYLIGAFCIIQFLVWLTKNNNNKIFQYLGRNSIMIYGIHRPLLSFFQEKKLDVYLKAVGIYGFTASLSVTIFTIIIIVVIINIITYLRNSKLLKYQNVPFKFKSKLEL